MKYGQKITTCFKHANPAQLSHWNAQSGFYEILIDFTVPKSWKGHLLGSKFFLTENMEKIEGPFDGIIFWKKSHNAENPKVILV